MPNRLIYETSPYLLQHSYNPVDWFPWGTEALEKASREQKPVFLSIGYAACHWCHVMAHETFEDASIASFLNENFVNIKVDREERPDLDSIYMASVVSMTGKDGWPMSVFLTPDGKPFFGGTYFPPTKRAGMPSFHNLITGIHESWIQDRPGILVMAQKVAGHIQRNSNWHISPMANSLVKESLSVAVKVLLADYDWQHGGWGPAPKFPQPMALEYLMTQAARGDIDALKAVTHSLDSMCRGGLVDVVGGGFHRYSTDEDWRVPHFEKMLYDNALIAHVYLDAHLHTGNITFRRVCEDTLNFILNELLDPAGGFYSSLDADSEGQEGLYYLWTESEVEKAIGSLSEFSFFTQAFPFTPHGNFEGKTILSQALTDQSLAKAANQTEEQIRSRLSACLSQLSKARTVRPRPTTDDKILVSWNALTLSTFAAAARHLNHDGYLQAARKNADFILNNMVSEDGLMHSWRGGVLNHSPAFLEDYAALILALLSLYQSDPDTRWYQTALRLAGEMLTNFKDSAGGFFDSRHENLLYRPKDLQDNATPSGNSTATFALLSLSSLNGNSNWRYLAEQLLAEVQETAIQNPLGYAFWLQGIDFALGPVKQIALLWPEGDRRPDELFHRFWSSYNPRLVSASSPYPASNMAPDLLQDRQLVDNQPTYYVCEGFACQFPGTTLDELDRQLDIK
jgi:uncharacterized protein YyaL (SSP411 family)